MLIPFPHPPPLSAEQGAGLLGEMDVGLSSSWALTPSSCPWVQSALFLALGCVSPQSCIFIPAAGTDVLTHLHWHTHTAHPLALPPGAGLSHTLHADAALGYHSPLPPTSLPETHTSMPIIPRESLTQEKSYREV